VDGMRRLRLARCSDVSRRERMHMLWIGSCGLVWGGRWWCGEGGGGEGGAVLGGVGREVVV